MPFLADVLIMRSLIVDFSYVIGRYGDRIVKELAIVDIEAKRLQSYYFKPPYTAADDELNYSQSSRGATWNGGHIAYCELERLLVETTVTATAIYAYGKEKCSFLDDVLDRSIIDLTRHFECPEPSSIDLPTWSCIYLPHSPHSSTYCALRSAGLMMEWLRGSHLALLSRLPPEV